MSCKRALQRCSCSRTWADEATLDVLRLLARRVDTVPGLVLVSYRDDELGRDHPLRIVLGECPSVGADAL
jgi:predicted ATPase